MKLECNSSVCSMSVMKRGEGDVCQNANALKKKSFNDDESCCG